LLHETFVKVESLMHSYSTLCWHEEGDGHLVLDTYSTVAARAQILVEMLKVPHVSGTGKEDGQL